MKGKRTEETKASEKQQLAGFSVSSVLKFFSTVSCILNNERLLNPKDDRIRTRAINNLSQFSYPYVLSVFCSSMSISARTLAFLWPKAGVIFSYMYCGSAGLVGRSARPPAFRIRTTEKKVRCAKPLSRGELEAGRRAPPGQVARAAHGRRFRNAADADDGGA